MPENLFPLFSRVYKKSLWRNNARSSAAIVGVSIAAKAENRRSTPATEYRRSPAGQKSNPDYNCDCGDQDARRHFHPAERGSAHREKPVRPRRTGNGSEPIVADGEPLRQFMQRRKKPQRIVGHDFLALRNRGLRIRRLIVGDKTFIAAFDLAQHIFSFVYRVRLDLRVLEGACVYNCRRSRCYCAPCLRRSRQANSRACGRRIGFPASKARRA